MQAGPPPKSSMPCGPWTVGAADPDPDGTGGTAGGSFKHHGNDHLVERWEKRADLKILKGSKGWIHGDVWNMMI